VLGPKCVHPGRNRCKISGMLPVRPGNIPLHPSARTPFRSGPTPKEAMIMNSKTCPDCSSPSKNPIARRNFLQAAASIAVLPLAARMVHGQSARTSKAETIVGEFHASLSEQQRADICRPFSDALRSKVNANWHVTKPLIGSDFFTAPQREMIEKIVRGLTSEEGYERLNRQMDDDDGGLGAYSVAIFGTPVAGDFQWLLTGRHLTLRADGDSVPKTAFGGGMVYGHGEESSADANIFYYQTKKVNEVFAALDKDQSKQALISAAAPKETDIRIQGEKGKFPGLAVSAMNKEQKGLVKDCLTTLLSPYRKEDGDEAMKLIEAAGGIDQLRFAFYQQEDLGKDKVWDIWRIEGPSTVVHFRGAPHVHAYINIAQA